MNTFIVLAVIAMVLAAPFAAAAKPDNPGNGKGKDKELDEVTRGNAGKATPSGQAKARGKPDIGELPGKGGDDDAGEVNESDDDAVDDEDDETAPNGKGKGQDKENRGQLISTAQQVRREQFQLLKDELKEMGYHGAMNQFATAYNAQIKLLKDGIQGKVNDSTDANFTRALVREVAERELAQVRERLMAGINVSDGDVEDIINESVGNESSGDENVPAIVDAMDDGFKKMFYATARYGAAAEQQQIKNQVKNYLATRKQERTHIQKINYGQLRKQLRDGASLDELLTAV